MQWGIETGPNSKYKKKKWAFIAKEKAESHWMKTY